MKLTVIAPASNILAGVKINKIPDRDAKNALLKCYLALHRHARDAEADKNEIAQKFQKDWADELILVDALRKGNQPLDGHEKYLAAEADANKAIEDLYEEEVGLELQGANADVLYDADIWGENDTLVQIANSIEFLVENGILLK